MSEAISRKEHLDWCKQRALEYCSEGKFQEAYASFISDMLKHAETSGHVALKLGFDMILSGHLSSPMKMREFIEGFN